MHFRAGLCLCHKCVHIFDLIGSGHTILRAAHPVPAPLHSKLIDQGRICRMRTPARIYAVDINPFGYMPTARISLGFSHYVLAIANTISTGLMILGTSDIFPGLGGGKMVDHGRLKAVRMPRIIDAVRLDPCRYMPMLAMVHTAHCQVIHKLDSGSALAGIDHTRTALVLTSKMIDPGWLIEVRMPRGINAAGIDMVRNQPSVRIGTHAYLSIRSIICVLTSIAWHQHGSRVTLPFTGPNMLLVTLPRRRLPKPIPVRVVR